MAAARKPTFKHRLEYAGLYAVFLPDLDGDALHPILLDADLEALAPNAAR